jgi:hypothetical protein
MRGDPAQWVLQRYDESEGDSQRKSEALHHDLPVTAFRCVLGSTTLKFSSRFREKSTV